MPDLVFINTADDSVTRVSGVSSPYDANALGLASGTYEVGLLSATDLVIAPPQGGGLEDGLTLSRSVGAGQIFTTPDGALPCIFAMDLSGFSASPSPGIILECGGAGAGMYLGVRPSNKILLRSGTGEGEPTPATVCKLVDTNNDIQGTGTLIAAMDFVNGDIRNRLYFNDTLIASAVAPHTAWTGGDDGAYLLAGGSGAGAVAGDNGGTGEQTGAVVPGITGALRIYENQTLPG